MSEMLKKARAYEAEKAAQTDKNTRPLFHISAPAGWINDPNGFSIYDGKIHLFYQYYPYAREWEKVRTFPHRSDFSGTVCRKNGLKFPFF